MVQRGLLLSKLSNKLSELQNTFPLPKVPANRIGTACVYTVAIW